MNKVVLMGRLTKDPEVRYSGELAIAIFNVAVNRKFRREGQPEADFFDCTAFRKTAEFIEKYLRKGTKVVLDGELQNDNYTNKEGQKVYRTRIMVNEIEFAESKAASEGSSTPAPTKAEKVSKPASKPADEPISVPDNDGFMSIPEGIDEELPFS